MILSAFIKRISFNAICIMEFITCNSSNRVCLVNFPCCSKRCRPEWEGGGGYCFSVLLLLCSIHNNKITIRNCTLLMLLVQWILFFPLEGQSSFMLDFKRNFWTANEYSMKVDADVSQMLKTLCIGEVRGVVMVIALSAPLPSPPPPPTSPTRCDLWLRGFGLLRNNLFF